MPRGEPQSYTIDGPNAGPSVVIVGAGVAGLATGCYLQMNGFNTHILERHQFPGGCCTAWERDGYVFDYCIEWLLGSGEGNEANQVWQELGALAGKTVQDFALFNRVVSETGDAVDFYNDPARLEAHLLSVAPDDAKEIRKFCDAIRGFLKVDIYPELTPKPLQSLKQKLALLAKILPAFRLFWYTGATSLETFATRIKHPFLKRALPFIFFQDHECFPILPYVYNMAEALKGNAGFPEGGSLGIARSIEARYLKLGGKITYGVKADEILVESTPTGKAQASGVALKNGKRYYADYVVSAADGHTTLYHMLGGRFISKALDTLYNTMLHRKELVYPGVVSVFVGFKGRAGEHEPHSTTFLLDDVRARKLPGCLQKSVLLQHRSRFASGFAPDGCSIIHLTYLSDFEPWQHWRQNNKPYYREQKRAIDQWVRDFLEKRYPGIGERIDVVEVATPVTQKRYTGNTQGSILAWKAFTEAEDLANKVITQERMQLPGLSHFYMAGQWVGGGGLIRAALSGRYVAQYLCAERKQKFVATHASPPTEYRWHNREWRLKKPVLSPQPSLENSLLTEV